MVAILVIKLFLYYLCKRANHKAATVTSKRALQLADPTLEALAQDHWNDTLSNGVAAAALIIALYSDSLWFLDPIGAILISLYIIWSWYETGKDQIEQLT
jgi:divalent metal cation (Fe/Co/Zn/Cd) transporter